MKLQMKCVYDAPAPDDGYRVLVDRLWPRGERKEDIPMDRWEKMLLPRQVFALTSIKVSMTLKNSLNSIQKN